VWLNNQPIGPVSSAKEYTKMHHENLNVYSSHYSSCSHEIRPINGLFRPRDCILLVILILLGWLNRRGLGGRSMKHS
jgi:hypothetical protein